MMGKVSTGFSMSLDGFIAHANGDVGPLFDWYFSGNESTEGGKQDKQDKQDERGIEEMNAEGKQLIEEASQAAGALIAGRRLFDYTKGWGGKHPLDVPVFVVTHTVPQEWVKEGSPFTFVTDGVESAIAQAQVVAGEKRVLIASANVLQQCLRAGLVDEIHIDLVPVLLGEGIRLFDQLGVDFLRLESTNVQAAPGVTHLDFRIVK